jgi:thiamine biosynthesis lipoprotein
MIKKISAVLICIMLSAILLSACSNKAGGADEEASKEAFKMDTIMTIKAYGPKANEAIDAAYKRIDEIEQMASTSIETSEVSKINQAAGKEYVKVHPEVIKMIKASVKYSELTNGAFDITVGPLIKLWGIGTDNRRVPSDSEISATLPFIGYKNISINETDSSIKLMKEGMSIDLGGIAKGFAADEVVKVFKSYGIQRAIINLGGSSVYALGEKPDGTLWSIGIQHPRKERNQGFTCIVRMPQQALSTSGDYERYFIENGKRYHHILNPLTGYPADTGIMSDTIVVDSSIPDSNMEADILTKVTFVSGVDKGFKIIDSIPGVACLATTTDNKVYKSSNWKLQIDALSEEFSLQN